MEKHVARFRLKRSSTQPVTASTGRGTAHTGQQKSCNRCRYSKKRCSRTRPECSSCVAAGAHCFYAPSERQSEAVRLRQRLAWIETLVDESRLLDEGQSIQDVPTGTAVYPGCPVSEQPASPVSPVMSYEAVAELPDDPSEQLMRPALSPDPRSFKEADGLVRDHQDPRPASSSGDSQSGSEHDADGNFVRRITTWSSSARHAFIDAYFRDAHRAYPFMDPTEVLSMLQSLEDDETGSRSSRRESTLLYLSMAIGYNTLRRTGQLPGQRGERLRVPYEEIVARNLQTEDMESVEVLLLLSIYVMFDLSGLPCQPVVDLLCRRILHLGLAQRSTAASDVEVERHHRIFWSVYVLDSLLGVSTGMPIALRGANMNVPLPKITVAEFAAPDSAESIATLQVSRHLIQLRQLENKVLHEIHLRDQTAPHSLTDPDRRSIVERLRTEIDDWHSNGCLLKSTGSEHMSIYIRIPWLGARYYNLLFLLYYPSQYSPTTQLITQGELVSLAQKHVQANMVRLQQGQLGVNYVMLCRLLPICLVFMDYFVATASANASTAALQVNQEVDACADIMSALPPRWISAHRAAGIMRRLAVQMRTSFPRRNQSPTSQVSSPATDCNSFPSSQPDKRGGCGRGLRLELLDVMRNVIGPGSVYLPLDYARDF